MPRRPSPGCGELVQIEAKRYEGRADRGSRYRDEFLQHLRKLQDAADAELTEDAAGVAMATGDVLAGAPRGALPAYAARPYLIQQCCLTTSPVHLTTRTGAGIGPSTFIEQLAYAQVLGSTTVRITVTFGDRRQFQDYKADLLRFVDALLACLLRMLVVLLSALAHQAMAPAFLLVMLGSIRHYGRRGEPPHAFLPLALTSDQQRGAVRLAA